MMLLGCSVRPPFVKPPQPALAGRGENLGQHAPTGPAVDLGVLGRTVADDLAELVLGAVLARDVHLGVGRDLLGQPFFRGLDWPAWRRSTAVIGRPPCFTGRQST